MQYISRYQSPFGGILLACDDQGLTGLWFDHEKYYALNLDPRHMEKDTAILQETRRWLDIYFDGTDPDFFPPLHMSAVGHNEISIIVPCHRVVGKNGSLTGYAGGIDKKSALLKLEGAFQDSFFVPKYSTAP